MKELIKSIQQGNLNQIKSLLNQASHFHIDMKDEDGLTLLMYAVSFGHLDIVRFLIEKKANVNAMSDFGSAVIHFIAETNHFNILRELIQHGIHVSALDVSRESALHYAVKAKQYDMLIRLIALGLNVNGTNNEGQTPLHHAVLAEDIKTCEILLASGADIEIKDVKGLSPLIIVSRSWNQELIDIIAKYKKENNFILNRTFSNVFNRKEIIKILQMDGNDYKHSGTISEAKALILSFLKEFQNGLKKDDFYSKSFKRIIKKITDMNSSSNLVKANDANYFYSGHTQHVFYGSMKKEDQHYVFLICERGDFSPDKNEEGKVHSVRKLSVSDEQSAQKILDKLHDMNFQEYNKAFITFYVDIPQIAQKKYEYENHITQSYFKRGRCYFENLKSLLLSEFVREFGLGWGKILYKAFDLFMHKIILDEFKSKSNCEGKRKIIQIAEAIIREKDDKFITLYDQNLRQFDLDKMPATLLAKTYSLPCVYKGNK